MKILQTRVKSHSHKSAAEYDYSTTFKIPAS